MKIGPKILHDIPDLEKLAEKHQNFDALMDAYTDERLRKKKKFYRLGSFAMVIIATTFLSWLYWGYDAVDSNNEVVKHQQKQPKEPAVTNMEPAQEEKAEEPVEIPVKVEVEVVDTSELETDAEEVQPSVIKEEPKQLTEEREEPEVIAAPKVSTEKIISQDALPVDGLENLYRYLYREIDLPDSLLKAEGSLFLEVGFEVGKAGEISNITFSKELPQELIKTLTRIFAEMPAWRPALEKGDVVVSEINLPITFQKKKNKE